MKKKRNIKLAVTGLLLLAACQYPVISFFSIEGDFFGIPILLAYLLAVWITAIVLITRQTRKLNFKGDTDE